MYKVAAAILLLVIWIALCTGAGSDARQTKSPPFAKSTNEQMKDFWNECFSKRGYFIGTEPDEFFADELEKLKPGTLLLPGEGEGRNAVYAASRGWRVDAFDFSEKAKLKALKLARQSGVTLNYQLADFAEPRLANSKYDLVAIIDLPTLPDTRRKGFSSVRESLVPGGIVIYEGYVPKPDETIWASLDELKKAFAGFKFTTLKSHHAIRRREGKDHIDLVVRMVAVKVNH